MSGGPPVPPAIQRHSRQEAQRRLQVKRCFKRMATLLELEKELHGIILDELLEGKDAALQATYDVLKLVFNRLCTKRLQSQLRTGEVTPSDPPAPPSSPSPDEPSATGA